MTDKNISFIKDLHHLKRPTAKYLEEGRKYLHKTEVPFIEMI